MIFRKYYFKFNSEKTSFNKNEDQNQFKTFIPIPKLIQKNKIIAFGLCLLFGVFGIHRFYLGKYITGTLQLLFSLLLLTKSLAWLPFVFAIIDIFRIAFDERFTKKLVIDFICQDFTATNEADNYTTSPFSNFNDREPAIRELNDDEVVVVNSTPIQLQNTSEKTKQ
ncbi:MAG: TM2 domain-containing protein [Alphaproteobacteria bacterium]|jgi:TM2 domain-containing membrane protein YozV|nr:TM2 domain-containing protein [Alphaproteobacteria bacterium]